MKYISLASRLPKNCPKCGAEVQFGTWDTCQKCGAELIDSMAPADPLTPQPQKNTGGKTNPLLAALLSFIFPGLGQLYNSHILKGIVLIVIALFSSIIIFSFAGLFPAGIFVYLIVWCYGIYDAYRTAQKMNAIQ